MKLQDVVRSLSPEAAAALQAADPKIRRAVVAAYSEHHDRRGWGRRVVTTPPTAGSHRYPWRRK